MATVVNADQDLERRYLAKIHNELRGLKPFLDRAEEHASSNERFRFDHKRLRIILKRIMLDIEAHINQPSRTPYLQEKRTRLMPDSRRRRPEFTHVNGKARGSSHADADKSEHP